MYCTRGQLGLRGWRLVYTWIAEKTLLPSFRIEIRIINLVQTLILQASTLKEVQS